MNTGDTAFILFCAAVIFFMTPGLALFYAGLVRKKNAIDIMTQSYIAIGVVTIIWVFIGFSLAFGDTIGGVVGNLQYLMLHGVTDMPHATLAPTIPFLLFFVLQLVYAIISPALVAGAVAERIALKAYILFLILWSVLIYVPFCHWVWGGGFLASFGFVDFAGGAVIHMSTGFSALATTFFFKKRQSQDFIPHNIIVVSAGVAIVWFGWLAFNAGAALGANGVAVYGLTNSLVASASGLCMWMLLTAVQEKRPSFMSLVMGGLAGLVCVTPSAGYVTPVNALIIGAVGACVSYFAIAFRSKKGMDDTLDVWGLHGMGGLTGIILTGIFADGAQLHVQLLGALLVGVVAFVLTWIIFKVISWITPLYVTEEQEQQGIDATVYHEQVEANSL